MRVKIETREFQEINRFNYLEVTITNNKDTFNDTNENIMLMNKAYCGNKKLIKSRILQRKTNINKGQ